jgi:gliding motility-associated-like protein
MKDMKYFFQSICVVASLVLSGFTADYVSKSTNMPPSNGDIVNFDTVKLKLTNCTLQGGVCLPITLGQALKLVITDNGEAMDVSIMNGCDNDTTSAYTYSSLYGDGNAGPYILTSWNVNNQSFTDTFQNIPELVTLMNGWDPMGNWVVDPTTKLITGGNSANIYDTMQVWVTVLQSPSFLGYNQGITPNGTELSFDRGFHQVILEDTVNMMADTFYVHAYCQETINRSVLTGSATTECLSTIDLLAPVSSISFCGADPSNSIAGFTLNSVQNCVTIQANTPGTTSACAVLCDGSGFCDTTFFNLLVHDPGVVTFEHFEMEQGGNETYCFDASNTNGNIVSITTCGLGSNQFATYTYDASTQCVRIEGITEGGVDTACMIICNDIGVCDTAYLTTLVRRFGPEYVYDTVGLFQPTFYCVDQYLAAPVTAITAFIEPDANQMLYALNSATYCVEYSGLLVGTDTLGLVVSNAAGQTDTTYLYLTFVPPAPTTVIDTVILGEQTTVCFDLSELPGDSYSVTNFCEPFMDGDVIFTFDNVNLCLEYTGSLAGTDTACYSVCDNFGVCDTFTFVITALDTITPVNQLLPSATNDSALTDTDVPVTIPVLANDQMNGAQVGNIIILPVTPSGNPTAGLANVDITAGTIIYTPPLGLCATTDYLSYVICNAQGCDTAQVFINILCDEQSKELVFYQGFSPNNDDTNDKFIIENADQYPDNELFVYNRWGSQVFYAKNYRNNWDANWNSEPLPDGTYYYIFMDGTGKKYCDYVVIKR